MHLKFAQVVHGQCQTLPYHREIMLILDGLCYNYCKKTGGKEHLLSCEPVSEDSHFDFYHKRFCSILGTHSQGNKNISLVRSAQTQIFFNTLLKRNFISLNGHVIS